jgi:hypothetical protein
VLAPNGPSRLVQMMEEDIRWHSDLRAQIVVALSIDLALWRVLVGFLVGASAVLVTPVDGKLWHLGLGLNTAGTCGRYLL